MSELDGLKLFKRIEERVAGKTGEAFFREITAGLATALDARAAFAGRLNADRTSTMLAFWLDGEYQPNATYALDGTPCEFVYKGEIRAYPRDISSIFPADRAWFESIGVKSYIGVPFKHETGEVFGHLAVMDSRERDWADADFDVLRVFALRSAAELERYRYEQQLEQVNAELNKEIRRREEVEKEMRAAQLVAETANQAKSVFISNMSHELRTPLNGILGYTQLLANNDGNLTQRQREGLAIIERSGRHLLTLINDLLDLAKIEAGKIELLHDDFELASLLSDIAEVTRVRAQNAQLSFRMTGVAGLPAWVHGDARALRQVLLNLLANAVKFTDAGGSVGLHAGIAKAEDDATWLEFRIEDTGVGIPAAHLSGIFEPFYRVAGSQSGVEGTGLGLAITQRLLTEMGGQVTVTSAVERGSVFTARLPLQVVASGMMPVPSKRHVSGYVGQRLSVLVADDDATNRHMLAQFLGDLGFVVELAADGQHALDQLCAARPDLVITDLIMPRLDGMALVQAWRERELAPRLPIIALSASAGMTNRESTLAGGCDAFLPKPVDLPALLDCIEAVLGLEWTVAEPAQGETSASMMEEVGCDAALVAELQMLAARGDIMTLMHRADETLARNPDTQPIYRTLCGLAEQYDMRGIRRLFEGATRSTV